MFYDFRDLAEGAPGAFAAKGGRSRQGKGVPHMRASLQRSRLTVVLGGLGMLALGLSVMVNPIGALAEGVALVGWILVIVGALTLLAAALQGGVPPRRGWADIVVGGLDLVLGIVLVAASASLVGSVWLVLGAYVLLTGVHTVLDAPRLGSRIAGGVVAALGAVVIVASCGSSVLGMLACCLVLVVAGVIELVCGLRR